MSDSEEKSSQNKGARTISRASADDTAANPFNRIKLDLAVILLVAAVVFVGSYWLDLSADQELGLMLAVALLGAVWIMARSRAIIRHTEYVRRRAHGQKQD